ncbi:MAG TPA: hypothetical protein VGQ59_10205, partial [Cyclobacteriaceae bacterium]|nr:hypothetical protein [Cyclobacteriaceae bacterium]
MKPLYQVGKNMYLIGIAELAIYSFFRGDIGMTRPSYREELQSINPALAYVSGAVLLICVLAVYLNKYRNVALLTIANIIFWLVTTRHIFNLWRDHINGFKTLWLIGGAFLILGASTEYQKHEKKVLFANAIILFLFFVDCGVAHFQYPGFVATLIPDFIPFHTFFTYFAAVCLIAGGVGLLIPQTRKLAALLSGVQITGWFFLLHIPRALTL